MFKISSSDFETVGMRRQKRACTDTFLATVTESVVQGKVEVNGCSALCHKVAYKSWTVDEGQGHFTRLWCERCTKSRKIWGVLEGPSQ